MAGFETDLEPRLEDLLLATRFVLSQLRVLVAYDRDKLPIGLKTIADLFDTKKLLGKTQTLEKSNGQSRTGARRRGLSELGDVPVKDRPSERNAKCALSFSPGGDHRILDTSTTSSRDPL